MLLLLLFDVCCLSLALLLVVLARCCSLFAVFVYCGLLWLLVFVACGLLFVAVAVIDCCRFGCLRLFVVVNCWLLFDVG